MGEKEHVEATLKTQPDLDNNKTVITQSNNILIANETGIEYYEQQTSTMTSHEKITEQYEFIPYNEITNITINRQDEYNNYNIILAGIIGFLTGFGLIFLTIEPSIGLTSLLIGIIILPLFFVSSSGRKTETIISINTKSSTGEIKNEHLIPEDNYNTEFINKLKSRI